MTTPRRERVRKRAWAIHRRTCDWPRWKCLGPLAAEVEQATREVMRGDGGKP